jgi:hypothetical protein
MNCFKRKTSYPGSSDIVSHFRNLHGLSATGSEVTCTSGGCPRVFLSFRRLKDHAISDHGASNITEFVDCSQPAGTNLSCNSSPQNYLQLTMGGSSQLADAENVNFRLSYMRFITALGSKPGISPNAIQAVAEELCTLVKDARAYAVDVVHGLTNDLSVPRGDHRILTAVDDLNCMTRCLSGFETEFKRRRWLKANGYFIEPNEVVLGTINQLKYCSQQRRRRAVVVEDTYQYIPLDKLLAKIVEDPLAQSHIHQYRLSCKGQFPRMRDFVDTSTYKSNDFLQRHPNALLLHFLLTHKKL